MHSGIYSDGVSGRIVYSIRDNLKRRFKIGTVNKIMKMDDWDSITGEHSKKEVQSITVKQLIEFLQKCPGDYEVGYDTDEGRFPLYWEALQVSADERMVWLD